MSKTPLKPCPFCGCQAMRFTGYSEDKPGDHFVQCLKCFASTEIQETKGAATRKWNRRVKKEESDE